MRLSFCFCELLLLVLPLSLRPCESEMLADHVCEATWDLGVVAIYLPPQPISL